MPLSSKFQLKEEPFDQGLHCLHLLEAFLSSKANLFKFFLTHDVPMRKINIHKFPQGLTHPFITLYAYNAVQFYQRPQRDCPVLCKFVPKLNLFLCYFHAFCKAFLEASFCDITDTRDITPNTHAITQYSKSSFKTSNILEGCTLVQNKSEIRNKKHDQLLIF